MLLPHNIPFAENIGFSLEINWGLEKVSLKINKEMHEALYFCKTSYSELGLILQQEKYIKELIKYTLSNFDL